MTSNSSRVPDFWGQSSDALNQSVAAGQPTKAANITERLRHDIISCRLEPGSKLPFERLTREYGVGISTLRESLASLTAEGFVYANTRRGFWVTEVSRDDLEDLLAVRLLLETEALSLSIEKGDDEWEGRVVQAHHIFKKIAMSGLAETQFENMKRHFELHETFLEACGSRRLLEICRHLLYQMSRYRFIFSELVNDASEHWDNHVGIVDAIIARDAEGAVQMLRQHVQLSRDRFVGKTPQDEWERRIGVFQR